MVVRRGGKLIPLDRHPIVIFMMAWAVFVGASGAVAVVFADPRAPAGQLPWWLDLSWYLLLGGGATMVLVGMWWRDAIAGVLIARAGYWPLGAAGLIYSAALSASGNHRSAVIIVGFALCCIWRAVQIRRDVCAELLGG